MTAAPAGPGNPPVLAPAGAAPQPSTPDTRGTGKLTTDESISPSERRELRAVVRAQFKVLRTEVKQRKAELLAEAESRLVERYRDDDRRIDELNFQIQEIGRKAGREIDDLKRAAGLEEDGGRWVTRNNINVYGVSRRSEDRTQLHRALEAGVNEQVTQALLALDRQEADLLKALAMESLESAAARAFLDRIPAVGELVPAARLREIETVFDQRRAR